MADVAATPVIAGGIAPRPAESRWRGVARTTFPFLVVGVIWEVLAHSGLFPPRLFPPVETIGAAFVRPTVSGVLYAGAGRNPAARAQDFRDPRLEQGAAPGFHGEGARRGVTATSFLSR
jgi:hypothetical protein